MHRLHVLCINVMLDCICMAGVAELWGTGTKQKHQYENVSSGIRTTESWRLRPFGHADSWRIVFKSLTLSCHMNEINTIDNTWINLIMVWCVHAKFCKQL